jgi:hypothetical protein
MGTTEIPLALSALVFAVFATVEWRRMPVCARIYLGVATAFALGAMTHPGMSVQDVLAQTRDGMTYLVATARMIGFTAVLVSLATFIRSLSLR